MFFFIIFIFDFFLFFFSSFLALFSSSTLFHPVLAFNFCLFTVLHPNVNHQRKVWLDDSYFYALNVKSLRIWCVEMSENCTLYLFYVLERESFIKFLVYVWGKYAILVPNLTVYRVLDDFSIADPSNSFLCENGLKSFFNAALKL